jgi:hypothetical protein
LINFIAAHPEIEIGASIVNVPENVRPEFYRAFNEVRLAFMQEKHPKLCIEAQALSNNYLKIEERVTKLLGVTEVSMVENLYGFLKNPGAQLMRELFDPLYDLLKDKISIDTFEEESSRKINAALGELMLSGYNKWVIFSLINLLESDKSFQVPSREFSPHYIAYDVFRFGCKESLVPPEESRHLSYKHDIARLLIAPDVIVHSTRLNRFVSIGSANVKALGRAANVNEKREWYLLNTITELEPTLNLIYIADSPEEISLVSDQEKICRPDLIIKCITRKDCLDEIQLDTIKAQHDNLKPKLGTYIVSKESVQVSPSIFLNEGIRVISVGFDQSKLKPIIRALGRSENQVSGYARCVCSQ